MTWEHLASTSKMICFKKTAFSNDKMHLDGHFVTGFWPFLYAEIKAKLELVLS